MAYKFTNFGRSTLQASINSSVTSLSVAAGEGARFPTTSASDYFMIVLTNNLAQREIMKVTTRATDTFTVVRGQEGTTAIAFSAGDRVSHRLTAGAIDAAFGGAIPSAAGQAGKVLTSDGTTASYSSTITADLTIDNATPELNLNATALSEGGLVGKKASVKHWAIVPGDATANSDLTISRYDNAGSPLGVALKILRATGQFILSCVPTIAGKLVDVQVTHNSAQRIYTTNSSSGSGAAAGYGASTDNGTLVCDLGSAAFGTGVGIGASFAATVTNGAVILGALSDSPTWIYQNGVARIKLTGGTTDFADGSGTLRIGGHITRFMSSAQTVRASAGTTAVGAHGGSRAPDSWKLRVRLKNSVQGYTAGDITEAVVGSNATVCRFNATNAWIIQFAASVNVLHAATGASVALTSTDAELFVFAEWW